MGITNLRPFLSKQGAAPKDITKQKFSKLMTDCPSDTTVYVDLFSLFYMKIKDFAFRSSWKEAAHWILFVLQSYGFQHPVVIVIDGSSTNEKLKTIDIRQASRQTSCEKLESELNKLEVLIEENRRIQKSLFKKIEMHSIDSLSITSDMKKLLKDQLEALIQSKELTGKYTVMSAPGEADVVISKAPEPKIVCSKDCDCFFDEEALFIFRGKKKGIFEVFERNTLLRAWKWPVAAWKLFAIVNTNDYSNGFEGIGLATTFEWISELVKDEKNNEFSVLLNSFLSLPDIQSFPNAKKILQLPLNIFSKKKETLLKSNSKPVQKAMEMDRKYVALRTRFDQLLVRKAEVAALKKSNPSTPRPHRPNPLVFKEEKRYTASVVNDSRNISTNYYEVLKDIRSKMKSKETQFGHIDSDSELSNESSDKSSDEKLPLPKSKKEKRSGFSRDNRSYKRIKKSPKNDSKNGPIDESKDDLADEVTRPSEKQEIARYCFALKKKFGFKTVNAGLCSKIFTKEQIELIGLFAEFTDIVCATVQEGLRVFLVEKTQECVPIAPNATEVEVLQWISQECALIAGAVASGRSSERTNSCIGLYKSLLTFFGAKMLGIPYRMKLRGAQEAHHDKIKTWFAKNYNGFVYSSIMQENFRKLSVKIQNSTSLLYMLEPAATQLDCDIGGIFIGSKKDFIRELMEVEHPLSSVVSIMHKFNLRATRKKPETKKEETEAEEEDTPELKEIGDRPFLVDSFFFLLNFLAPDELKRQMVPEARPDIRSVRLTEMAMLFLLGTKELLQDGKIAFTFCLNEKFPSAKMRVECSLDCNKNVSIDQWQGQLMSSLVQAGNLKCPNHLTLEESYKESQKKGIDSLKGNLILNSCLVTNGKSFYLSLINCHVSAFQVKSTRKCGLPDIGTIKANEISESPIISGLDAGIVYKGAITTVSLDKDKSTIGVKNQTFKSSLICEASRNYKKSLLKNKHLFNQSRDGEGASVTQLKLYELKEFITTGCKRDFSDVESSDANSATIDITLQSEATTDAMDLDTATLRKEGLNELQRATNLVAHCIIQNWDAFLDKISCNVLLKNLDAISERLDRIDVCTNSSKVFSDISIELQNITSFFSSETSKLDQLYINPTIKFVLQGKTAKKKLEDSLKHFQSRFDNETNKSNQDTEALSRLEADLHVLESTKSTIMSIEQHLQSLFSIINTAIEALKSLPKKRITPMTPADQMRIDQMRKFTDCFNELQSFYCSNKMKNLKRFKESGLVSEMDQAFNKFLEMIGISMEEFRKNKFKIKDPSKYVIVFGVADFHGSNSRFVSTFVKKLKSSGFKHLYSCNEYYTSQRCPRCFNFVKAVKGTLRVKECTHCIREYTDKKTKETKKCSLYLHRDSMAAHNMCNIAIGHLRDGERPWYLVPVSCKESQTEPNSESIDKTNRPTRRSKRTDDWDDVIAIHV